MLRVAVVLLAGACGGPAKTSPPPPPPANVAPPPVAAPKPPTCREAVARAASNLHRPARQEEVVAQCEANPWSDAMRTCVAAAPSRYELQRCFDAHFSIGMQFADEMAALADEICACTALECAQPIYDRALEASKRNTGTSVTTRVAETYVAAGERLTRCMQELLAKVPAKP